MKLSRVGVFFLLLCTVGCPKPKEDTTFTDALLFSALGSSRGSTASSSPTVTSVTPTIFYVGSTVTIKGTNLSGKTISIFIGSSSNTIPTTLVSQSNTEAKLKITSSSTSSSFSGTTQIGVDGKNVSSNSLTLFFVKSISSDFSSAVAEVNVTSISTTNSSSSGLSYTISPSLPSGLSFNTSAGTVSGTPTASTGINAVAYTVTGTNIDQDVGGSVTGFLFIAVVTNAQRTNRTCNTVGTFSGCSGSFPYSCTNSPTCYSFYSTCSSNTNTNCGF
jgi:hypothetical protein